MKDCITRATILVVILSLAVLVGGAYAASAIPDTEHIVWPTYHMDHQRDGQNALSTDIGNPATIGLVWAFPRDVAKQVSDELSVVDDATSGFTAQGDWTVGPKNSLQWLGSYIYSPAVDAASTGGLKCWWNFPSANLDPGSYQIAVWIPPAPTITVDVLDPVTHEKLGTENVTAGLTRVAYTVYDDNGPTKVTFDQNSYGRWELLSTVSFSFNNGSGTNYKVELSTATGDTAEQINTKHTIVIADAIKFIPSTGMEIYASPASAEMYYTAKDNSGNLLKDSKGNPVWNNALAPFAFVGTVENPLVVSSDPADTGAVYCINSITPTTSKKATWDVEGNPDKEKLNMLSNLLGTTLWRYPNSDPSKWTDLEGPIEGGFYASPTLAYAVIGNDTKLVCFVAAMDRQVYALDAYTGALLWKGPGITASEEDSDPLNWIVENGVTGTGRRDAFGGKFHWAECDKDGAKKNTWTFSPTDRNSSGFSDGSFSVYAWIPAYRAGEANNHLRCRDARYKVYYQKVSGSTTTEAVDEVTVDQSNTTNQGRWIKLGQSFYGVSKVELDNSTRVGNTAAPESSYAVAADAVMIVPSCIGDFGYSTPVTNLDYRSPSGSTNAEYLYAANSAGRVIAFDIAGGNANYSSSSKTGNYGKLMWIYPHVRTSPRISSSNQDDQPVMGPIGASPVFNKTGAGAKPNLYVATTEGRIYCLGDITTSGKEPSSAWSVPYFQDSGAATADDENTTGFTSSPAVDGGQMFIGSTGGDFYCLNTADGSVNFKYPDTVADPEAPPLGSFAYSTPAVTIDSDNRRRAWIGSTDGRVYSFSFDPGHRLQIDEGGSPSVGNIYYIEPNTFSPIQGSIALDSTAGSRRMLMFVGDMNGLFHWFDAQDGLSDFKYVNSSGDTKVARGWQCSGQLFSSPNITTVNVGETRTGGAASWIYTGCADGRVYAFSHGTGAWGGDWVGGEWPFEGEPNGDSQRVDSFAPDTDIQFDLFPGDFYEQALKFNPEPSDSGNFVEPPEYTTLPFGSPNGWNLDAWPVGKAMKEIDPSKVKDAAALKKTLLDAAKSRRQWVFDPAIRKKGSGATATTGLYFEWGESLYMMIWNMPELKFLAGSDNSSKMQNIRLDFTNGSPGESSGGIMTFSAQNKVLRDYTVIDVNGKDVTVGSGDKARTVKSHDAIKDPVSGDPVRRSYLLAKITIDGRSNRPCPGPGWYLTARIRYRESTDDHSPYIESSIPIAKLETDKNGTTYLVPATKTYTSTAGSSGNRVGSQTVFDEQTLGINNPIAIADENKLANPNIPPDPSGWDGSLGWGDGHTPDRNDPQAHFNGNVIMTAGKGSNYGMRRGRQIVPLINLDYLNSAGGHIGVGHGRTSRQARLGVMDRSAMGINLTSSGTPPAQSKLSPFRVDAGDLRFRGGSDAIGASGGKWFPWEQGAGSADYPDIARHNQRYLQASSDTDPTRSTCELPPLWLKPPYASRYYYPESTSSAASSGVQMAPDMVLMQADVPQYQPANMLNVSSIWSSGYGKSMETYIDNNGNGAWDSGVVVRGRPALGQEPYRRFRVQLGVPADPKLEVDEQLIDLGSAPHGLGEALGPNFGPLNPSPNISQWFKKLTVKNAGNVNLWNLRVGRNVDYSVQNGANPLYLYSDGSEIPLPGSEIVSSLDMDQLTALGGTNLVNNPFVSLDTKNNNAFLGCTLTKPRVGDPDPTVLTIPDKRKWDQDFGNAATNAAAILSSSTFLDPTDPFTTWKYDSSESKQPLPVEVGVRLPITQPIGTYSAAFVPIYCDTSGISGTGQGDYIFDPASEIFANPSFQLKISVKESQLTGGITPTTLPQIDTPIGAVDATGMKQNPFFPPSGDTTPAAFKDHNPAGDSVHLIWSTNRLPDWKLYPGSKQTGELNPEVFANAPWFLHTADLQWDGTGHMWQPDDPQNPMHWWKASDATANPFLPSWQWPAPNGQSPASMNVMPWTRGVSDLYMVKHHSPSITEDQDLIKDSPMSNKGLDWLVWVGEANKRMPAKDPDTNQTVNKLSQEHMIFYTDVTKGNLSQSLGTSGGSGIFSITHDLNMVKRAPNAAIFPDLSASGDNPNELMWMFWQGGESGRWSIYYSLNNHGSEGFPSVDSNNQDLWSPDMKLRTPDSLSSVTSPNVLRTESPDTMLVVYAGTGKLSQNSDIYLGRYVADPNPGSSLSPGRRALPMPRVYNEKLMRDAKHGYYTSQHIAWLRPDAKNLVIDSWGDTSAGAYTDFPYIHVLFPAGYKYTAANGSTSQLSGPVIVSATDGGVWSGSNVLVPPTPIKPLVDDATGLYTYKYIDPATKVPTLANQLLGDSLVDYSSGVVRFTRDLKETPHLDSAGKLDGTMDVPEVRADYTPQTWRITTDPASDTSPRAFIEHAKAPYYDEHGNFASAPADRLWVFWRKAGTGVDSSTIFYKTYRIGIDLAKLGKPWAKGSVKISGVAGSQIGGGGSKLYVMNPVEHFRSNDAVRKLSSVPVNITYEDTSGQSRSATVNDVSWVEEMPEQALLGFASNTNVNEGGIYAFADDAGTNGSVPSSKIWVFWTSTRGGNSDLFWETLSPNFSGR